MVLLQIFLKYLIADLPLILVSFFSMYFITKIYLKHTTKKRRWSTLILIEGFEHLVIPVILFFILLAFNNLFAGILFNFVLMLFLFGFIGKIVVKAEKEDEWINVLKVGLFTLFFIYIFPYAVILFQVYTDLTGWWILIGTACFFFGFYLYKRKNETSSQQHSKLGNFVEYLRESIVVLEK